MNETGLKVPRMETIAKTAELFGVSQYFVRKLANSGKINAVRISGRILINCDKFVEYLNNVTLQDGSLQDCTDRAAHIENGIRRLDGNLKAASARLHG